MRQDALTSSQARILYEWIRADPYPKHLDYAEAKAALNALKAIALGPAPEKAK